LTKRGTTAINYAEDGFDDDDFEDSEGPRRPTGLRSLRRDDSGTDKAAAAIQLGKELNAPVEIQGIWREWMGKAKRAMYVVKVDAPIDALLTYPRTEKQLQTQAILPLTLIPIRVDLDIQPFKPDPALPPPPNRPDLIDNDPAYKHPDMTPAFRLKDTFLWNLHEALMTPDHFAKTLVDELDLPADKKPTLITLISNQIRQQLEEYAGVALHPLFPSTTSQANAQASASQPVLNGISRDQSSTPAPAGTATPATTTAAETNRVHDTQGTVSGITATATAALAEDVYDPDDAYRCLIILNINLMNRLYTDKFEWSLLHPPGFPEIFAKQTCADLGLTAEWVPAISHAIYEAVLRLKKEVCENGGLVGYNDIDNDAAEGVEAGWRYEPERLAADWEPTVEILSKEEIERREGDRERQIRRLRRETARFSSTANMPQNDFFANPESQDQPMGRGERSKKKRRFRSLSPLGRDTPDTSGYGGGGGLQDWYVSHVQWLRICKHTDKHLGNVTSGNVHTARSGDMQCGEFEMDHMVRALCVPIAAFSTKRTRCYLHGQKASSREKLRMALGN
jgi:chromatin structure-remodeling complex subunit SFH1